MLLRYLAVLLRTCLLRSWVATGSVPGAILVGIVTTAHGAIHFVSSDERSWTNVGLSLPIYTAGAWLIIFTVQFVFFAPYRAWQSQKDQIRELEKVGKDDLERMLHGEYLDDAMFFYTGGDFGRMCRDFKCKGDIELLKDVFTAIPVQAPKGAVARIDFRFTNPRPLNGTNEQCHFYVMRNGESIEIEDMHATQDITLDQDGCFRLKLSWSDKFVLDDHASLRITMDAWMK
jgi:hypothetical protein